MPFCCKHTEKAHELIQAACSRMIGKSVNETSEGGKIFRTIIPWASNYDKAYLSSAIKDYKDWMSTARDYLQRAEREMGACNCSEEEKKKNIQTTEKKFALEEKLEIKEIELTKVVNKFNDLRMEDRDLINKNNSLKEQVKELSKYKLISREEKLGDLILDLGVNEEDEEKLEELHNAYERKDDDNIRAVKKDLRKNFRKMGIKSGKTQEIFEMCEEIAGLKKGIAELEVHLEQFQQQEEESKEESESRDWKNINSNFTLKLIREWQDLGFTYEQCADWIRINSNQQQDQAIKEFAYYAWLRDEKKLSAEWVLSNGSEQELRWEFLRWQQQQQYFSAQEHKS